MYICKVAVESYQGNLHVCTFAISPSTFHVGSFVVTWHHLETLVIYQSEDETKPPLKKEMDLAKSLGTTRFFSWKIIQWILLCTKLPWNKTILAAAFTFRAPFMTLSQNRDNSWTPNGSPYNWVATWESLIAQTTLLAHVLSNDVLVIPPNTMFLPQLCADWGIVLLCWSWIQQFT
jgi:hypothetical protein